MRFRYNVFSLGSWETPGLEEHQRECKLGALLAFDLKS